jgi:hypothetical protein
MGSTEFEDELDLDDVLANVNVDVLVQQGREPPPRSLPLVQQGRGPAASHNTALVQRLQQQHSQQQPHKSDDFDDLLLSVNMDAFTGHQRQQLPPPQSRPDDLDDALLLSVNMDTVAGRERQHLPPPQLPKDDLDDALLSLDFESLMPRK